MQPIIFIVAIKNEYKLGKRRWNGLQTKVAGAQKNVFRSTNVFIIISVEHDPIIT